jgi:DNA-binding response OmpR family regulator
VTSARDSVVVRSLVATNPDHPITRVGLVVIADPVLRQLCYETLCDAGFVIANSIMSGAEAVIRARELNPDVILLSQQLSDVPAFEAIKWLRSNRESAGTPIIVLGGKATDAGLATGVTIVTRPINANRLRIALIDTLGHKSGKP